VKYAQSLSNFAFKFNLWRYIEGLQILCFPCNQFGSQEPKGNDEIKVGKCKSTR